MKHFLVAAIALLGLAIVPAQAQVTEGGTASNAEVQILREKLAADKKHVVAQNMALSDAEAPAFWKAYDSYQADLGKLNQRIAALVGDYAQAYGGGTVSDDVARKLTAEMLAIEADEAKMRASHAKSLAKVVSPVTAARYLQIESKIRALVRFDLASKIPLIP